MIEDEVAEDRKVGSPGPSRGTSVRLDAIDVMNWDIESEIIYNLEIG